MTGRCATCGATMHHPTIQGVSDMLYRHHADRHEQQPTPIVQLPSVTFHEQALRAILALCRSGRPFTLGDAHPMVEAPPANPQTEWPAVLREAVALGWCTWTGDYAESKVPTTKRSAVKVWRGTAQARKAVA